jgi:hypothetical protein
MGLVLGQDRPQMPFAEDQHPVCDLLAGGEHELFRISVRPSGARRDLHHLDTGTGQDCVKRRSELSGPVPDKDPEAAGTRTPAWQRHCGACHTPFMRSSQTCMTGRLPASINRTIPFC